MKKLPIGIEFSSHDRNIVTFEWEKASQKADTVK